MTSKASECIAAGRVGGDGRSYGKMTCVGGDGALMSGPVHDGRGGGGGGKEMRARIQGSLPPVRPWST
jgi:hypothetical protein